MLRGSIFKRFTLLSVFIAFTALIPLVGFGLYAVQMASDYLVRRTLEELKRDVLVDADKIKRVLDMAQGDLTVLNQLTLRKLARARVARNQAEMRRWYDAIGQAYLIPYRMAEGYIIRSAILMSRAGRSSGWTLTELTHPGLFRRNVCRISGSGTIFQRL